MMTEGIPEFSWRSEMFSVRTALVGMLVVPCKLLSEVGIQRAIEQAVGDSGDNGLAAINIAMLGGTAVALWLFFSKAMPGHRLKTYFARFVGNSLFGSLVSLTVLASSMLFEQQQRAPLEAMSFFAIASTYSLTACTSFTRPEDKNADELLSVAIMMSEMQRADAQFMADPIKALQQLKRAAKARGFTALDAL